jgi:hypothetical protein
VTVEQHQDDRKQGNEDKFSHFRWLAST